MRVRVPRARRKDGILPPPGRAGWYLAHAAALTPAGAAVLLELGRSWALPQLRPRREARHALRTASRLRHAIARDGAVAECAQEVGRRLDVTGHALRPVGEGVAQAEDRAGHAGVVPEHCGLRRSAPWAGHICARTDGAHMK